MPSMIDLGFAGAALLAALAVPVAQAQSAHHDHAAHTAATQTPTQRWTTDAPLRAGMRDLRDGQKISYEIVQDKRSGKSSADNLRAE